MDFNNSEIKENTVQYNTVYSKTSPATLTEKRAMKKEEAKPLSQSEYIENLVLSTPPQHQKKTIQKSCLINPYKKKYNFFSIIKIVANQPKK